VSLEAPACGTSIEYSRTDQKYHGQQTSVLHHCEREDLGSKRKIVQLIEIKAKPQAGQKRIVRQKTIYGLSREIRKQITKAVLAGFALVT
jgi:hypothetical protein